MTALVLLASAPASAASASPRARTGELLRQLARVQVRPDGVPEGLNDAAYNALDGLFDHDGVLALALGGRVNTLTSPQRQACTASLRCIIRYSWYQAAADRLRLSAWEITRVRSTRAGQEVSVRGTPPHPTEEAVLVWRKSGERWRLVDLGFGGDFASAGWRVEFTRVLDSDGAEALVRLLRQRADALARLHDGI